MHSLCGLEELTTHRGDVDWRKEHNFVRRNAIRRAAECGREDYFVQRGAGKKLTTREKASPPEPQRERLAK
ncbi:hypothetical protein E2C01_009035 [Portunus trituberculatus]|uniref:Uncharacterized protein n=1 Tax=Portunus trituberculatus TaxID=210409 RepID=A0A5B7D4E1_PORTR|nr:hypothetical protein [Portunus trituberculatus]